MRDKVLWKRLLLLLLRWDKRMDWAIIRGLENRMLGLSRGVWFELDLRMLLVLLRQMRGWRLLREELLHMKMILLLLFCRIMRPQLSCLLRKVLERMILCVSIEQGRCRLRMNAVLDGVLFSPNSAGPSIICDPSLVPSAISIPQGQRRRESIYPCMRRILIQAVTRSRLRVWIVLDMQTVGAGDRFAAAARSSALPVHSPNVPWLAICALRFEWTRLSPASLVLSLLGAASSCRVPMELALKRRNACPEQSEVVLTKVPLVHNDRVLRRRQISRCFSLHSSKTSRKENLKNSSSAAFCTLNSSLMNVLCSPQTFFHFPRFPSFLFLSASVFPNGNPLVRLSAPVRLLIRPPSRSKSRHHRPTDASREYPTMARPNAAWPPPLYHAYV